MSTFRYGISRADTEANAGFFLGEIMRANLDDQYAIASDFGERYQIRIANNEELRSEVYRLRYRVFCQKLGYDMSQRNGLESDEFDRDSVHVLLRERAITS